jgi:hypothetical protein
MGSKGALIAGGLMFIDLFLPWNRACSGAGIPGVPEFCFSASGWQTAFGVLAGLLTLALIVWEGLNAAGALSSMALPKKTVTAALAGGAGLFALLRFVLNLEASSFGAYVGVILALALLYVAYTNWQEQQAGAGGSMSPPPPAPPAA